MILVDFIGGVLDVLGHSFIGGNPCGWILDIENKKNLGALGHIIMPSLIVLRVR